MWTLPAGDDYFVKTAKKKKKTTHNLQSLNCLLNTDALRQLVRHYSEGGRIDSVNISLPKGQNQIV